MTLARTPSFSEVLEKDSKTLEALEAACNGNISRLQNGQRNAYWELWNRMQFVADIASTQRQRDDFDPFKAHGWHKHFMMPREMNKKEWEKAWERMPRSCLFRMFQEAFTADHQRALPRNFELLTPKQWHQLGLEACQVAPDRTPDTLLVDLGYVDAEVFEDLKGEPLARLAKKAEYDDCMRASIESAVRISHDNPRIRRVARKNAHAQEWYPDVPEVADAALGSILYFRHIPNGDGPAHRQVSFFPGTYPALRKTAHEDDSYAGEIDTLAAGRADLQNVIGLLDDEYKANASAERKEELWATAQPVIVRYNNLLLACQDRFKIEARDFLLDASDLRDARGKPNISRVMTKVTAALARIAKRFDAIKGTGSFNHVDRLALHNRIAEDEYALLQVRRTAERGALHLENGPTDRERIVRDVKRAAAMLPGILFRPLTSAATALGNEVSELTNATLERGLLRIHVIGKLQGILCSIERMKGFLATERTLNVERLQSFLERVDAAVTTRQIFPAMEDPELAAMLEPLVGKLKEVHAWLGDRSLWPTDEKEALRTFKEDILDQFDLESTLRNLKAPSSQAPAEVSSPHAAEPRVAHPDDR